MALKQLMINKKITSKRSALEILAEQRTAITLRSEQLGQAIDEAEKDEELEVVEEQIAEIETETENKDTEISELEGEIASLEAELEALNDKAKEKTKNTEGREKMPNNLSYREGIMNVRESLQVEEVRDFYNQLSDAVNKKRAITGLGNTIPTIVLDRIQSKIGDYSTLYNEVTIERLNGDARVIIAGSIPEAIWTEVTDAVQELADSITVVELDAYQLGGYVPVHQFYIDEALVNLATVVEDRLAKASAKALDKAILVGTGAAGKQPVGIVSQVTAENKVTVDGTVGSVLAELGKIDSDGTSGEVIAVMNRKTYYGEILPQLISTTADGRTVTGSVTSPNIAGVRVVLSAYAPDAKIILGDFKEYLLGERLGVRLSSSEHVRFIEGQVVFKSVARYDGKPVKASAFAELTITAGA